MNIKINKEEEKKLSKRIRKEIIEKEKGRRNKSKNSKNYPDALKMILHLYDEMRNIK